MSLLLLVNFLTTILLGVVSIWAGVKVARSCSRPDMIAPVVFVVLVVFACPVFLDWLLGIPYYEHSILGAMNEARFDDGIAIIYNLYVSFFIAIFTRKIGDNRVRVNPIEFNQFVLTLSRFSVVLYIGVFIPFLLLPFTTSVEDVLTFGVERVSRYGQEGMDWKESLLAKMSIVSVVCATFLWCLNSRKKDRLKNTILLIVILFDCLFQGKRSLFFLACVFYLGLNYFSGISLTNLVKRSIAIGCIFTLFFVGYGKNIGSTFHETYVGLRADFGRDDVTKYTMKKVLVDDGKIVDYPGHSFVFWGTFWIPRAYWADKPWPYAVYFTNSLLPEHVRLRRISRGEEFLGWGMTTSIVEEVVANFKWGGLLFPIGALWGIFAIQRLAFIPRCVAFSIFVLLLGIHFIAIYPFYILLGTCILIWGLREKIPLSLLMRVKNEK